MMAEVLGIVASILSISKAIISGVNLASELYKAPEEIRTLHVSRTVLQFTVLDDHSSTNISEGASSGFPMRSTGSARDTKAFAEYSFD